MRVVDRRAAFEAALESPVDLILADFSLVDFDAIAALRYLAERDLDVPVIVVTGAVGEEKAAECIREGASDYLLKDRLVRLPTAIEGALWMALRALEEKSALSRRMADERFRQNTATGSRFRAIAEDAEAAGATLRRLVAELGSVVARPHDTAAPLDHPAHLPHELR